VVITVLVSKKHVTQKLTSQYATPMLAPIDKNVMDMQENTGYHAVKPDSKDTNYDYI